jgi:hypothetical protein
LPARSARRARPIAVSEDERNARKERKGVVCPDQAVAFQRGPSYLSRLIRAVRGGCPGGLGSGTCRLRHVSFAVPRHARNIPTPTRHRIGLTLFGYAVDLAAHSVQGAPCADQAAGVCDLCGSHPR